MNSQVATRGDRAIASAPDATSLPTHGHGGPKVCAANRPFGELRGALAPAISDAMRGYSVAVLRAPKT